VKRSWVWTPFLLAVTAAAAVAQTAGIRELSVLIGRGELLQFGADIQRVAVSEPKIADAVVVSPREVMVNGKGAGKASLVVWETGQPPARSQVTVSPDLGALEALRVRLAADVPEGKVELNGNEETLVLTGSVKSREDAARLEAMASTHSKKVVNLLQLPPAPEPKQILLQVRFASVDRVALQELGFNWFSRNEKMLGAVSTQQFTGPRFSQLQFQNQQFADASVNFSDLLNIFLFRPDLNIGATIKALQQKNLLQILAEPNLICIEGKQASFLAGGQFPFPTIQATTTGGAVAPVVTVQFKDFGVNLNFVPTVTPSGGIHLKVAPEVSALDFVNAVTLQGFLIPAVATRRAETEVILKDGESFAIAGLIDNRVLESLNRVWGLGDIPILGYLFRSRSTKKTRDELLVVITPRFVKPLSPEEQAKLPDLAAPFLQSLAEEQAANEAEAKAKADKKNKQQPEFVGPRGHQEPK